MYFILHFIISLHFLSFFFLSFFLFYTLCSRIAFFDFVHGVWVGFFYMYFFRVFFFRFAFFYILLSSLHLLLLLFFYLSPMLLYSFQINLTFCLFLLLDIYICTCVAFVFSCFFLFGSCLFIMGVLILFSWSLV